MKVLQHWLLPALLPPHPSVPPLKQAEQIVLSLKLCAALHPQVAALNTYLVPVARKSFLAHSVQCLRGNIPILRPLQQGFRNHQCVRGKLTAALTHWVVRILWVGDHKIWVFNGRYQTFDVLFILPHGRRGLGRRGCRIIILIIRKLPVRSSTSVALSILVPTAAASSSVARVVLLILPALHPQLMVAMVGSSRRRSGGMRVCGDGGGVQACGGGMRRRVAGRQSQRVQPMVSVNCLRLSQETRLCINNLRR